MFYTNEFIESKVKAFADYVLAHHKFVSVLEKVTFHLNNPASAELIVLVGPTGIGKSLMMGHISKKLNDSRMARANDPDYRPVVHTVAMASGRRQFDFKTLYREALKNLGDPIMGHLDAVDRVYLRSLKLDTTASLRTRMQDEMCLRETLFWLLDEAQHLVFGGKSGTTGDQFDVLKSIAQMTNCTFLLAGPCKMEAELASSSQLARRIISVPFDRYHHGIDAELQQFGDIANSLMARLDLAEKPNVDQILTLLYEGSAGCVGILKDWLTRSYARALNASSLDPQRAVLTIDILREMRMPVAGMAAVMEDIRRLDESMKMNGSDAAYSDLVRGPVLPQDSGPITTPQGTPSKLQRPSVGIRSATRDSINALGM